MVVSFENSKPVQRTENDRSLQIDFVGCSSFFSDLIMYFLLFLVFSSCPLLPVSVDRLKRISVKCLGIVSDC